MALAGGLQVRMSRSEADNEHRHFGTLQRVYGCADRSTKYVRRMQLDRRLAADSPAVKKHPEYNEH